MKILLAGGAGYIGSALAPSLIEDGYSVEVVDLLWFGDHLPDNIKIIKKDIFDCSKEDIKEYDQVIFLAGVSNDPMAEYSPAHNFIANAASPAYLAFTAKQAGVKRFIYASSCSVYGFTKNEVYNEESPTICQYPYGASKLQGEQGVLQQKDDNFSVIALRQGTVSGFSSRMRFDLIVNAMFKSAMTTGEIIVNNPDIRRPVLDIRDAVSAYRKAIQADYDVSGVFNIASANYTVGEVAELVKNKVEELAGKKIKITTKNIEDFRNYVVSFEKAKKELGFLPRFSVKDIVQDLFDNQKEFDDYENDRFYNIRVFKNLFQQNSL